MLGVLEFEKKENEDFATYGGILNKECEKFKLNKLTPGILKCLIFAGMQGYRLEYWEN